MIPFKVNMKFQQIPNKEQKMKDIVNRTIAYAADKINIEAKAKVPVRTGRLQGSITQGELFNGRWVGPNTPYDIYVEFGTSKMKAQPYMRPAIDTSRKLIADFMVRRYREVMR